MVYHKVSLPKMMISIQTFQYQILVIKYEENIRKTCERFLKIKDF